MNVLTSQLRIYPKDKSIIGEEEQDHILRSIVRVREEFGSYWVRIWKFWNQKENCFEIQYGSSKTPGDSGYLLESKSFHDKYYVWERLSDEGGFPDKLLEYYYEGTNSRGGVRTRTELCVYKFDEIHSECPIIELSDSLVEKIENRWVYNVKGTYNACNDRGYQDASGEYSSPCLGYAEEYVPPYFSMGSEGPVRIIEPNELRKVFDKFIFNKFDTCKIELLFKSRVVYKRVWEFSEYEGQNCWVEYSADSWDNLVNYEYTHFRHYYL